ncbi:SET domain-containing protein [Candidatus Parcubacteria bacterium]|nr:SET domain-containing protein [Candidatus Parcubacteria bacterium]
MKVRIFDNYTVGQNHYGKAVFAARNYKKGDAIVMFSGPIVDRKNVPKNLFGQNDRYVQISPTKFMGPSNTTDDLINHSCDPNAGLKFTDFGVMLVAIKTIKAGDEITWDYSTTLYRNKWTMQCLCNSKKCRKTIKEFKFLPEPLRTRYLKLGILPPYAIKLVYN